MDFILDSPWWLGIIICFVFYAIRKGMNIELWGMKFSKPDKADDMPIQNTNKGNNNGIVGNVVNSNIVNINNNTEKQEETYMKHIYQLCTDVLTYTKNNKNQISEIKFREICGDDTDDVFVELKSNKIGNYAKGTKTIWSISKEEIDKGLSHYKKILNNR